MAGVRASSPRRGAFLGLAAACTFGVSAPLATRLVDDSDAQLLAGLLYLGAALALAPALLTRRRRAEAPLRRDDAPTLALVVLSGGVVAPVLLLIGLSRTGGLAGSLLLNLEGPLTVLVAVSVFGEHLTRRSAAAGVLVLAAAALMGLTPGSLRIDPVGVLLIAAACAAWALDNNLTATLVARDPVVIVSTKVAVAGAVNLTIAVARGAAVPVGTALSAALALGAISYGISVLLDAYALRALGAAREAALFATAPFAGALLSIPLLGDRPTPVTTLAMVAMAGGAALLLTDRHGHAHRHAPVTHDHRHRHDDDHHDHGHDQGLAEGETPARHTHAHQHEPRRHVHAHASDAHHRHRH